MGAITNGLLKIITGFLYGIGFMAAIGIGSYFVINQIESEFESGGFDESFTSID